MKISTANHVITIQIQNSNIQFKYQVNLPWNTPVGLPKAFQRKTNWKYWIEYIKPIWCPQHRPSVCEIWWMTSKNNRALLLYYVKLCASFQIHWWIQTGFIVHKRSIRVEIGDILSRVTLKFDRWPWTTIGHLLYTTPSFVHHNKPIGKVKPELQSGNAQVRSKLAWPWNFMDDLERQ